MIQLILKHFREGKGPLRRILEERMRKDPLLKKLREQFFKTVTRVYDADTFYNSLRNDLKEAKNFIIIISPFLHTNEV